MYKEKRYNDDYRLHLYSFKWILSIGLTMYLVFKYSTQQLFQSVWINLLCNNHCQICKRKNFHAYARTEPYLLFLLFFLEILFLCLTFVIFCPDKSSYLLLLIFAQNSINSNNERTKTLNTTQNQQICTYVSISKVSSWM